MTELIARNDLSIEQMVSCIFTSTTISTPSSRPWRHATSASTRCRCSAPRRSTSPNAMRSVIRVLLHYYAPADHTPAHAYLGEAQELRSDLKAAQ